MAPASSANHVLIVGASGLVGTAAANAFLAAGWRVTTLSRRRSPFIEASHHDHIALDLTDPQACATTLQNRQSLTHIVYAAVHELPGLMPGWSDPQQIDTNARMLQNLLAPILAQTQLSHVTLLQGTKAYGAAVQPIRVPAREAQPRVEHDNFYWQQEDYLVEQAQQHGFHYTILRPQLIVGPNYGVVMNIIPIIGAYAALRTHEGLPFSYPGGADWVWEATDARLVGDACLWAADAEAARNETFNLTNGEVFLWRDMWPAIAHTLGVRVGADDPVSFADYCQRAGKRWRTVVQEHNLKPIELDELLGESHHYADLCFNYGRSEPPPPTFISTVKIKQAGFTQVYNSEESICHWLQVLQQQRILPQPLH